ncbi:4Fe-4S dicluster domain-containing protein [bacterium]|nr:4Fe-4S dicluster domain-containing protein [bacterium]
MEQKKTKKHSLQIDLEKCVGCVLCMKACPIQAIRVRNGKAVIDDDRCVDCGECYRVCPHDAVRSQTTSFHDLKRFKYTVALPSPVLYTQFGREVSPNQILLALKKIGFDYVVDVAWICEKVNAAYRLYIEDHPTPMPMISTVCPAVVRLVAFLYPELADHIIPIDVPREVLARELRSKISRKKNVSEEEIGVIHITSCAAKIVSINNPIGLSKSALDGAIAINDIYGKILDVLDEVEDDEILQQSSGVGIGWAASGGEVRGIELHNCLAVSGVKDVIQILDELEAGKLKDIKYLEALVCPDGCIGGTQVVENRHVAKHRAESLVKMYGERSRVSLKVIKRQYREGYYTLPEGITCKPLPPLDIDPVKALQKRQRIEEIIPLLGGKECGACGAPNCKTLARDIVLGEAEMEDCVFIKLHTAEHK